MSDLLSGRVKVACINWSHPDAPHAMAYVLVDGAAEMTFYCATWAQAMERANNIAGRIAKAKERANA